MKTLLKSLTIVILMILTSCETKQDCLDRMFDEQEDKFYYYISKSINYTFSNQLDSSRIYEDSASMCHYTLQIIIESK